MVNKVRVTIAGAPYAIATTDSEKYIASLAKRLDEDITKLLDTNENLSVTKAAVFCAMDYLDEYKKSTGSAENMRSQIQDYIADAARAKLAEDKVRTENETLRRENDALRKREWGRGERAGTKGVLCQRSRSLPRWAVKRCSAPRCSAVRTRYIWAFRASMPVQGPEILMRTA